jgi:hypothetical protein
MRDVTAVAGLCGHCSHGRRVTTDRGAVFLRCNAACAESGLARYPQLPVLACPAFAARRSPEMTDRGRAGGEREPDDL